MSDNRVLNLHEKYPIRPFNFNFKSPKVFQKSIEIHRSLNLLEKYPIRPNVLLPSSDIAVDAFSLIVGDYSGVLHVHPAIVEYISICICFHDQMKYLRNKI